MSQQLRVAGQLVDGVTKLMHEQLALLNETAQAFDTSAAGSGSTGASGRYAEKPSG